MSAQRRCAYLYTVPLGGLPEEASTGGVPREWLLGAADLPTFGWEPVFCPVPKRLSWVSHTPTRWLAYQALWVVLRRDVDAIVCATETPALPIGLLRLLRLIRPAVLVQNVALLMPMSSRRLRLWRLASKRLDIFVSFSTNQPEELAGRLDIPTARSRVLLLGIDTIFWTARGSANAKYDILAVGSNKLKDFPPLLRNIPAGRHVTVVTDELNAERIGALCSDVRVNMSVGDLRDVIAQSDVLAIPLRESGASSGQLSLLAAAALGVPTIASDVLGLRDYITSNVVALVDPGRPGDWKVALSGRASQPKVSMSPVRTTDDWSRDLARHLDALFRPSPPAGHDDAMS